MTTTSTFVLWAVFGLVFGGMIGWTYVVIRESHSERDRVEAHERRDLEALEAEYTELPTQLPCMLCGEITDVPAWFWRIGVVEPGSVAGLRCPKCASRLLRYKHHLAQIELDRKASELRARMEAAWCWDLTQDAGGGPA